MQQKNRGWGKVTGQLTRTVVEPYAAKEWMARGEMRTDADRDGRVFSF
jgi:hypothetical protein